AGSPSRTTITFSQVLHRIFSILPRTFSSAMEYRVLQRSHWNFIDARTGRLAYHGNSEPGPEACVEEVAGLDVPQGRQHLPLGPRVGLLHRREHALHDLSLLVGETARQAAAAHHGVAPLLGVGPGLRLGYIGQRPDDDVPPVLGHEARRHAGQPAREEQV